MNSNEIKIKNKSLVDIIKSKQYKLVKERIRDPATNVNVVNSRDCPVIFYAANSGEDNIVKLLLGRKDIDINLTGSKCTNPLHAAALKGHTKIVRIFLNDPRIIINDTVRDYALKGLYNKNEINTLIEDKLKTIVKTSKISIKTVNTVKSTINNLSINEQLFDAINKKNIDKAKELLKNPEVDVNYQDEVGDSALHLATKNELIDIIKILFEHPKINVNIKNKLGYSPVFYLLDLYVYKDIDGIIKDGMSNKTINLDILKLYLDNKNIDYLLESNKNHNFFEKLSAYNPSNVVYDIILNNPNIDPNAPYFFDRYTFLLFAIEFNNITLLKYLINHQLVNVNLGLKNNDTAIELAAKKGNVDAVKLLLESPRFKMSNDIYLRFITDNVSISDNKDKILQLVKEYLESKNIKYNTTIIDESFKVKGLILPPELKNIIVTKFHHIGESDVTKHNIPIINTRVKLSAMTNYNVGLAAYGNQIITDYIGKNTEYGICSTSSRLELKLAVITYKGIQYSVIQHSDYSELIDIFRKYNDNVSILYKLVDNFGINDIIDHNRNNINIYRELFRNCKEPLFFIIGKIEYLNLDKSTKNAHRSCIVINKETNEILISDSAMSLFPKYHFRNIEYYVDIITNTKDKYKITHETENCNINLQGKSDDHLCTIWSIMLLHIWLLNPQYHISNIVKMLNKVTKEQLNILINGYTLYLNKFFSQKESLLKDMKELSKLENGAINMSKLKPSMRQNILNSIRETRRLKKEGLNIPKSKYISNNNIKTRKTIRVNNSVAPNNTFRKKTIRSKLYSKPPISSNTRRNNTSMIKMYTRAQIKRMKEQGLNIPPEYR
jgi:ankyrin repeat protein